MKRVRIIDPYKKFTDACLRRLERETTAEFLARLERIGVLDKNGDLAPAYRTPEDEPRSKRARSRKRAPR